MYKGWGSQAQGADMLAATGDVVIVTVNYRLGALGFLSTGDNVVPGNMGLKVWIKPSHSAVNPLNPY